MQIVTRTEWGAKPPTRPPTVETAVEEVWLHHSVGYGEGGASYMRLMQRQHQLKGWSDIAYNWVIDPVTDIVYVGRGPMVRPGAQKGHNYWTMAVCFMGDFRQRTLTQRNIDTLVELMEWTSAHGFNPPFINGGHRDAPGAETTCPGPNIHKLIPDINHQIGDADMKYRNMENIPTNKDGEPRRWAMGVVDKGIERGYLLENLEYDWEDDNITIGRLITFLTRPDAP